MRHSVRLDDPPRPRPRLIFSPCSRIVFATTADKALMSKPRQILPGSTYLLTRRTSGRLYLLIPTPMVRKVFAYCLAHAARLYNIRIHGFLVMSNHYHLLATDMDGNLPAFMSYLNEFIAKVLNHFWGRWEYFWAPGTYSAVRLETADDVIDKLVYTLVNPVKSFLVKDSKNWPGISSHIMQYGVDKEFKRPEIFFRKDGPMPEKATLSLEVPPAFAGTPAEFKTMLNERIRQAEAEYQEQAKTQKKSFLGVAKVKELRHTDRPMSPAPRRNLNPHIASKDGNALRNGLRRLKWFRTVYEVARKLFESGDKSVEFPFGTYALQKFVCIQAIAPPDCLWI